jgi:surfactin synthase thioesterase subunit
VGAAHDNGPRLSGVLVRLNSPDDACARVVCLPPAGGGASRFRDWQPQFPASIELTAVRLPGRESRFSEDPLTTLDAAADEILQALDDAPMLPTTLFGHCSGAITAFELARRLSFSDFPPAHLVVASQSAPARLRVAHDSHTMPAAEIHAELRRGGGTPEAVLQDPEMLDLLTPIVRADLAVLSSYRHDADPAQRVECPITCLVGDYDTELSMSDLHEWAGETAQEFTCLTVPGDHLLDASWASVGAVVSRLAANPVARAR